MTLQALHSMEQAQRERAGICARLRANPNCSGAQNLLKQATGLTTASCETNLRAQKCAPFMARFPQYQSHAMSCEPQEVCKLGLEATMAEGCRRYGIEVKDGFLSMISAGAECLTQWQCLARTSFSKAMAVLMPAQFAARKGQEMGAAAVQSFRDDRAKLEKATCLDPETQAQLYCYLGVKYGGMALGVSGAARAAGAGLMARMASLEKDLVVSEVRGAAQVSVPIVRAATSETKALQNYIQSHAQHDLDFDLEIVDGKGVFSINHLGLDDRRLLALLDRAVRSGGISKINAGRIDGPKVLNLLTRLEDVVPKNAAMRVEGVMAPAALDKEALGQIARSRAGRIPADAPAYRWSDADVSNYQQARRTLRIDEACDRLFAGDCGRMRFSMDARNPTGITWTRAQPPGR